jgi:hypothetical protein
MKLEERLTDEKLDELFNDDNKCLEFLADLKWANGFVCRKCGNTNFCAGKAPWSRRCTRCKSEESATTGTIFHNCKFPVSKAFYIFYNVCRSEKEVSSHEFARRLSLRQMTCWRFKNKIETRLERLENISETEKSDVRKILIGQ